MSGMKVHLAGHLSYYQGQKQARFTVDLQQAMPLAEVIAGLGIPPGEIAFFVVNGELADPANTLVNNSDFLQLFPPSDGG
jgi:hypothetical protein